MILQNIVKSKKLDQSVHSYCGEMFMQDNKVLIVGAGPTGLMMALNLHRHRVPFRIVDKKEGITAYSKAVGMQARSLEAFRDFKLDQKMIEQGNPVPRLEFWGASKQIGRMDFSGLETEYPYLLLIAQSETERVIEQALKQQGIEIEWNTEVLDIEFNQDNARATFVCQGTQSQGSYSWVVGCDGLHGIVRDKGGIPFIGKRGEELFAVADVIMTQGPDRLAGRGFISADAIGVTLLFPLGKEQTRVVLDHCEFPPHQVPSLEYIDAIIKQRVNKDFGAKKLFWSSVFHIQYKQASFFSKGRCFLAGDAAHVHSPIGGQGMNTGLQDVYNLAWKLALVYHGHAHPALLNTYHEERSVNAKRLLHGTHLMTKIGSTKNPILRFLRPYVIHMIFGCTFIHDKIVFKISQLHVHYKKLSLSQEYATCWVTPHGKAFRKAPRAGERIVDIAIEVMDHPECRTFCDYLRGGTFHLVLFLSAFPSKCEDQIMQIEEIHTQYPQIHIALVVNNPREIPKIKWSGEVLLDSKGILHQRYGALKPCMYLIRPDKYIGMRSPTISGKRVKEYLLKIFR